MTTAEMQLLKKIGFYDLDSMDFLFSNEGFETHCWEIRNTPDIESRDMDQKNLTYLTFIISNQQQHGFGHRINTHG